jgi:hypothetical protein
MQRVTWEVQFRNKFLTVGYKEKNNTVLNINYIHEIWGKIIDSLFSFKAYNCKHNHNTCLQDTSSGLY